jgi:hypothetical protein
MGLGLAPRTPPPPSEGFVKIIEEFRGTTLRSRSDDQLDITARGSSVLPM